MGRGKDCEDILDNVKKEAPTDDCTLQAMTICYREVHKRNFHLIRQTFPLIRESN